MCAVVSLVICDVCYGSVSGYRRAINCCAKTKSKQGVPELSIRAPHM